MTRPAILAAALLLAACTPQRHACGPVDTEGAAIAPPGIEALGPPLRTGPRTAVIWVAERNVLVPIDTDRWACTPIIRVPGLKAGVGLGR